MRWLSSCNKSMICAWIVTSSAVVGSSAISNRGSQTSAIAIITRCRMPPDKLIGYIVTQLRGDGMPTAASASTARSLRLACRDWKMRAHRLGDLMADGEHRIECAHRLLKDHADAAAAHPAHVGLAELHQVATLEQNLAGAPAAAPRQQPEDRQRGERFAAAALADDADGLARHHGETKRW